jgi:carbohydrate diacid regulator
LTCSADGGVRYWVSTFNLVRTSAALYIHRNTLLYRLGKIEEASGRTLRDHRASLALYIACLADQLDELD